MLVLEATEPRAETGHIREGRHLLTTPERPEDRIDAHVGTRRDGSDQVRVLLERSLERFECIPESAAELVQVTRPNAEPREPQALREREQRKQRRVVTIAVVARDACERGTMVPRVQVLQCDTKEMELVLGESLRREVAVTGLGTVREQRHLRRDAFEISHDTRGVHDYTTVMGEQDGGPRLTGQPSQPPPTEERRLDRVEGEALAMKHGAD